MSVTVNGKPATLPDHARSLDELLAHLALPLDRVAVELNGRLIRRGDRSQTAVRDGDILEVVTLVGGG